MPFDSLSQDSIDQIEKFAEYRSKELDEYANINDQMNMFYCCLNEIVDRTFVSSYITWYEAGRNSETRPSTVNAVLNAQEKINLTKYVADNLENADIKLTDTNAVIPWLLSHTHETRDTDLINDYITTNGL